jgi:aldehyde:ferredoxin oxidoreductase
VARYEQLLDAVYSRRGWDKNGIPTMSNLHSLGIDLPEVIDIVQQAMKSTE